MVDLPKTFLVGLEPIGYYCQPKRFGNRIGSRGFGLELDNWVGSFQDIYMICPLSGTKITPSCTYRIDELFYLSAKYKFFFHFSFFAPTGYVGGLYKLSEAILCSLSKSP